MSSNAAPDVREDLRVVRFEVEGFRALRRLTLPELGRVNLFVGENNVGKTSLLEALRIYLSRTPATEVLAITREHTPLQPGLPTLLAENTPGPEVLRWAIDACLQLFTGQFEENPSGSARIGTDFSSPLTIELSLPWLPAYSEAADLGLSFTSSTALLDFTRSGDTTSISVHQLLSSTPFPRRTGETGVIRFPAAGLQSHDLAFMWRDAVAEGQADEAESAIREILPGFERFFVINHFLYVKIRDVAKPMPLESLGDGTNRVVGMALAFVRTRNGAVLIDEVENGLHHTVQADVWTALFSLAEKLNVQVFATTHSWEAVVAFASAATHSPAKGMLYRLQRKGAGGIYTERYTEAEVALAARHDIEVR